MRKKILLFVMTLCLLAGIAAQAERTVVQLYTPPVNLLQSKRCQVFVEGQELKLIDATVNYQRTWAANPILLGRVPLGSLSASGPVSIEVRLPEDAHEAVVRPLSRGIVPAVFGNSIRFVAEGTGPLTVEWNGDYKNALHLFLYPPEVDAPQPKDPDVLYFGPGLHDTGLIELKSGQTLYLAGGAVLRGAVHAAGQENIRILGRGIITGDGYDRWKDTLVPINIVNCQNVTIRDVTLIEPAAWCLNLNHSRDITVSGVNIIGWCSNSDGITIQSCERVAVDNCFVRSWDDSLVVKGYDGDSRGIHFRGCVLWTDLAQSMEIGYETRAELIEDISFENMTVLHNFHKTVMSVHNSDNALVRGIRFQDITVEDAQMGEGDGARLLVELTTTKSQWSKSAQRGSIRDVAFSGIRVLGGKDSSIRIFSFDREHNIDDVTFEGLDIKGQRITDLSQLRMNVNNRNGGNIRLLEETPQVSANYPGYLHTYKKAEAQNPAAEGFRVSASSELPPYTADKTADGNLNTYWEGLGQGEDRLDILLASPRDLRQVKLFLNPQSIWTRREQTIQALGSQDGEHFVELAPAQDYAFDPADGNQAVIEMEGKGLTVIRLVFTGNTGAPGAQVAEVSLGP
jgi:hypothetical protein